MSRHRERIRERQFIVPKNIRGICNAIALFMFVYALIAGDVPVGMMSLAVITGLVPPIAKVGSFSFGHEFQKTMYAFSITLFLGAMFLLLFY